MGSILVMLMKQSIIIPLISKPQWTLILIINKISNQKRIVNYHFSLRMKINYNCLVKNTLLLVLNSIFRLFSWWCVCSFQVFRRHMSAESLWMIVFISMECIFQCQSWHRMVSWTISKKFSNFFLNICL